MNVCLFCAHEAHNSFFCNNCGKILPANWDNYFLAFGLPLVLDVNISELKANYYIKLAELHPDKFSKASSKEKDLAQDHSAFLNFAYKCLVNPFLRAEHLIKILSPQGAIESEVSNDFLMEVMSWREQAEENDSSFSLLLKDKLKNLEDQMFNEIKEALSKHDIKGACDILARWRFTRRFIYDLQ